MRTFGPHNLIELVEGSDVVLVGLDLGLGSGSGLGLGSGLGN